jgi:SlyX protein
MNAEALEQIETKIAFLEHSNTELSDIVSRQQRDIEALRDWVAALAARVASRESDVASRTAEDERPPHY